MSLTGSNSNSSCNSNARSAASKPIDIPPRKTMLHWYDQFIGNGYRRRPDNSRGGWLDEQQDSPPKNPNSPDQSRYPSAEKTGMRTTKRINMS